MTARGIAVTTLRSGRLVDLLALSASDIDFGEVAERLAQTGRFGNAPAGDIYSVAQHCVLGADNVYAETGIAEAAGDFLLHDAHEYLLGDQATPVAGLMAHFCAERFADLMDDGEPSHIADMRQSVHAGIASAKIHVDRAICGAAGWWPERLSQTHVKTMDRRMLIAEMRMLWPAFCSADDVVEWCNAAETEGDLAPVDLDTPTPFYRWPADIAAREWLDRLERYCGVTP